jgi:Tol biopolymer transport system component
MKLLTACFILTLTFSSAISIAQIPASDTLHYPEEKHFKNIQQLTFGGENAEAYWSFNGKKIVFQKTSVKDGLPCDQIFVGTISPNGLTEVKMVSSGKGRTTCGYFTKDGKHIVYASTEQGGEACPPLPDRSKYGNKYIWPIYSSYDIYMSKTNGKDLKRLTDAQGYDAEATLSPDGKKMIFTSMRNGDLDLYVMNLKTGAIKQVTNTLGYDGGAWFSKDGKKIVWRASRPKTPEQVKEYKELLADGLVAPTQMEVFVANADGSDAKQVTNLGQANWAPNFTPDGRIIFCSNHEFKRGFPFNMYLINLDGTGLEKISHDKTFDAFPMFSYDGKKIIFSSNRNNGGTHETNVFIADWVR